MKPAETSPVRPTRRTARRPKAPPSVPPSLPTDHEIARQKTVWLAVVLTLVIAAGWLAIARWDTRSGTNPFQAVADQVSKIFSKQGTVASGSANGAASGDDAKLKELRELVFPQFTDSNVNKNDK